MEVGPASRARASGRSRSDVPVPRSTVTTPTANQDAAGAHLGLRSPTTAAGAATAEGHDHRQEGNLAGEEEKEEFHDTIPVPREIRFVDIDTTAAVGDTFATPPANHGPGAALANRGSPATSTGTSSSIRSHPNYAFLISGPGSAEAMRSGSAAGTNAGADNSPVSMRSLGSGSFVVRRGEDGDSSNQDNDEDGDSSNQDDDADDDDANEDANDGRGEDAADGIAAGGIAAGGGDGDNGGDSVRLAGDKPNAVGGGGRLQANGAAILDLFRAAWYCVCAFVVGILLGLWRKAPTIAKAGFACVFAVVSWSIYEQHIDERDRVSEDELLRFFAEHRYL